MLDVRLVWKDFYDKWDLMYKTKEPSPYLIIGSNGIHALLYVIVIYG